MGLDLVRVTLVSQDLQPLAYNTLLDKQPLSFISSTVKANSLLH